MPTDTPNRSVPRRQRLVPGLIGMAPRTNAVYYTEMHTHGDRLLGTPVSFRSVMVTPDFSAIIAAVSRGDAQAALESKAEAARRALRAGADFIVVTSNTGSTFAGELAAMCGCPVLGIAEAVCESACAAGLRRIGLIGTLPTLRSGMYQRAGALAGIEFIAPPDALAQAMHQRILTEFALGRESVEGRALVARLIRWFADAGADAAVLACTDLTLLRLGAAEAGIALLDSTLLHARAAAERAVLERENGLRFGD